MALDFPNNPTDGQLFDTGGLRYKYDEAGGTWKAYNVGAVPASALPDGGTTGQVLTKQSNADQDATFDDLPPQQEAIIIACSDEDSAIDATGTKARFRMPFAMNVTAVRASLGGACASGTFTVDINEAGASILSTLLTIDATEKTSTTATAPAVIADGALADDAEVSIDADDVGDGIATGLKVTLIGTRA